MFEGFSMNNTSQKTDIISHIRSWVSGILFFACLCELTFFYSPANFYGCLTLVYGWLLITAFVFKREYVIKYPLPTIAVFSLGICYFFSSNSSDTIGRKASDFQFPGAISDF